VAGVEGTHRGEPIIATLFRFRARAGVEGAFEATGSVPRISDTLAERGEDVNDALFEQGEDVR
jgi:hypothetical protein